MNGEVKFLCKLVVVFFCGGGGGGVRSGGRRSEVFVKCQNLKKKCLVSGWVGGSG